MTIETKTDTGGQATTEPTGEGASANSEAGNERKSVLTSEGGEGEPKPEGDGEGNKPKEGTEGDGEGEKKDGEGASKSDKDGDGAAGEYEAFTMPEGIEFGEETLGQFTDLAKELSLSQENAQKVIDLASTHVSNLAKTQQEGWNTQLDNWVDELKKDTDFGGKNYDATCDSARRVLGKFGDDNLKADMDKFGFGDHPGLARMFARIDKAIGEDTLVEGKPAGSKEKSDAEIIYPNS